jgi:hypothetical protein
VPKQRLSPTDRVEVLFHELVAHYGEGEERELRAAAKLLLVALAKFRAHGGAGWETLLQEYVDILKQNPERFERLLQSNSGSSPDELRA